MKPLLLHACCAPCSLEPVRLLREEGFEPTICWTNPNIQPHDEWQRRLDELRRWCADGDIELIEAGEDRERWEAGVAPLGADRARSLSLMLCPASGRGVPCGPGARV